MDDLKQWLKKILIIIGALFVIQLVALGIIKAASCLPFEGGCQRAGFSCPKGRGIAFNEVKYLDSIEDVETYYGWDYMIGGCGWVSVLNEAIGCEYTELDKNSEFSAKSYNFIAWGEAVKTEKGNSEVPLVRFSVGRVYGELVLPCSGYSCEYGNVGCSGCYTNGIQTKLNNCGE